MDESTQSIVNRDDPIPVLRIPALDDESIAAAKAPEAKQKKKESFREQATKLKGKLNDVRDDYRQTGGAGLQERLLNSLMQQIIPVEEAEDGTEVKDRRSRTYVDRPGFSLPAMSNNFRRFNARIGIVFVFQNQLIRLFTWRETTHTLSFLAVYTLVCLQPALLPVVPLALILFFVMIPSFLARHPPPPPASDPATDAAAAERYASYGYSGRPVAPPKRVKPAPEMSKDFFRNMRDLQNSMEDFSRVHDSAVTLISPYTDFSDEKLSTSVFLATFTFLSVAFVSAHLVPWRAVSVIAGWAAVGAGHPKAQDILLSTRSLAQVQHHQERLASWLRDWIERDIALDEPPEIREVEVFELQKLQSSGLGVGYVSALDGTGFADGEWEPWLFTPSPYDPMSPARISGARPTGTQFFEEVQPPRGWWWRDKKWSLDLGSRAWVEERMVTGVEIEIEGERWVYDIGYGEPEGADKGKGKSSARDPARSWEEGTGRGKKGEWRRRRWVRLVERKVLKVSPTD